MKFVTACLVSMLAVFASIGPTTAQSDEPTLVSTSPPAEDAFIEHLNATRTAAGLEPLRRDPGLGEAARHWARWMGERHDLRHADDIVTGAPADWTKAGENVGRGGTVRAVWDAFMDSPSHAANVLDPAFTRIGVGVVRTPNGMLYTAHRFAGAVSDQPAPVPSEEQAPTVPPATDSGTVDLDAPPPTELARRSDDQPTDRSVAPAIGEPASSDPASPDPERLAATMRVLLEAAA